MDFKIALGDENTAAMTWDKSDDISTPVYYSMHVPTGKLFPRPNFGLYLKDIKKVTPNVLDLFKQRITASTKWLIDLGKAESITIDVERNLQNINRIDYKVKIIQADGIPVTINNFVIVGGPV